MDSSETKTVVISGGSSGIGLALVTKFTDFKYRVYSLSRTPCPDKRAVSVFCDVSDEESVKSAFENIDAERIDILICNAGFGISGAAEFTRAVDVTHQFAVNFTGAHNCVTSALPRMIQGSKIFFTSSAAAVFAIPFQAYYSATKSALNTLAAALANELRPRGIGVCAVMLGDVHTSFTDNRQKSVQTNDLYGARIEKSVRTMEHDERNGMSPDKIADMFFILAKKRRLPPVRTVGAKYRVFVFLSHILPPRTVNYVIGKMYD